MSGGHYDYLFTKDFSDLLSCQGTLIRVADDLAKLGYADDVAAETMDLLLTLRAANNRVSVMKKRLDPVFRALEWWHSSDTSEEDFKKALAIYRKE